MKRIRLELSCRTYADVPVNRQAITGEAGKRVWYGDMPVNGQAFCRCPGSMWICQRIDRGNDGAARSDNVVVHWRLIRLLLIRFVIAAVDDR